MMAGEHQDIKETNRNCRTLSGAYPVMNKDYLPSLSFIVMTKIYIKKEK